MRALSFDPELLPVASLAGEGAIAPARLTPEALRERFAAVLAWEAEFQDASIAGTEQLAAQVFLDTVNEPQLVLASVLIPLVIRNEGLTLLLTRRTTHLTHHPGQISFPGGRAEDFDLSAVDTALRETEEEVGLDRRHVEVLGPLPDYVTGTGYRITPVVALVHPPFNLSADTGEVAEVFEVPLAFLMNGINHQRRLISASATSDRKQRMFYSIPYGQFFIWGATAGMLRNLFHFLRV